MTTETIARTAAEIASSIASAVRYGTEARAFSTARRLGRATTSPTVAAYARVEIEEFARHLPAHRVTFMRCAEIFGTALDA